MSVCFCTLAIHAPYRRRARLLCARRGPRALGRADRRAGRLRRPAGSRHPPRPDRPHGHRLPAASRATGNGRGAAAYHDKRFALRAALQDFDTAIFVDADSRVGALPPLGVFPPAWPSSRSCAGASPTIWRPAGRGAFPRSSELARDLTGDTGVLAHGALVPRDLLRRHQGRQRSIGSSRRGSAARSSCSARACTREKAASWGWPPPAPGGRPTTRRSRRSPPLSSTKAAGPKEA